MYTAEYSPFQHYTKEQHTDNKQTTSYKKYPTNKYLIEEDPHEVKHKLFHQENSQCKQGYYPRANDNSFFKNQKDKQFGNFSRGDSIIEHHMNVLPNKNQVFFDYSYPSNHHSKRQQVPKPKNKKSSNNQQKQQKQKLRSKSCQLSVKQVKKSTLPSRQQKQELQMYKKLCITLRKQNEDLQMKITKQQNQQSRFSSQIKLLKQKVRKMYDHCIENNKSSKNIDFALRDLINKHTNKQNINPKIMKKQQNNSLLREFKQKDNKSFKIDKRINNRTIDTVRTCARELNTSTLRGEKSFKKKKQSIIQKCINSSRFTQHDLPNNKQHPHRLVQYDDDESLQSQHHQPSIHHDNISDQSNNTKYKQFFQTFVKSLDIFVSSSSHQHKSKIKILKAGGYDIEWAKQQWLEIVQYLISKGYYSGMHQVMKSRNYELQQKIIR